MDNPFVAKWSVRGSSLCLGHWEIAYLGNPMLLDTAHREKDMGTYGIYSFIFPDDESFAAGLHETEWIEANLEWLILLFVKNEIPTEEKLFRQFYRAVNKQDWRCGSCGGCT